MILGPGADGLVFGLLVAVMEGRSVAGELESGESGKAGEGRRGTEEPSLLGDLHLTPPSEVKKNAIVVAFRQSQRVLSG